MAEAEATAETIAIEEARAPAEDARATVEAATAVLAATAASVVAEEATADPAATFPERETVLASTWVRRKGGKSCSRTRRFSFGEKRKLTVGGEDDVLEEYISDEPLIRASD